MNQSITSWPIFLHESEDMNQFVIRITPERIKNIALNHNILLTHNEARQCFEYLLLTNEQQILRESFSLEVSKFVQSWHEQIKEQKAS